MRVPTSLAVLVTGALVHHSSAQAIGYGTPDGNVGGSPGGYPGGNPGGYPSGNPGGNPDGNPGGLPGGLPGGSPNDNPYGSPSGLSNGSPTATPGGIPGTSPGAPTCVLQGTTTVFVTLYPTSPLDPSGLPLPGNSDPDHTIYQTIYPTTTVLLSPIESPQAAQPTVKPFTTLVIDVWGNDPDSGDNSGPNFGDNSGPLISDAPSAPVYTDAVPTPVNSPTGFPDASAASAQAPWSNPAPTVNSQVPGGASNGQDSGNNGPIHGSSATVAPGNAPYGAASGLPVTGSPNQAPVGYSSPYVVLTDTDVHWVPGPSGPSPITVLSPHTITYGSDPNASPGPDGSVPHLTVTGPDGKPTVIEIPGGQPGNGNNLPPVGAGVTTCADYTIFGPDGFPTVLQSTWVVPATAAAAGPTGLPSGLPSIPGANQGSPAWVTSYTVFGSDGRPTVVQSTLVLPAPINTQSVLAGASSGAPYPTLSGLPGQITPGTAPQSPLDPAVSGGAGITTCTSFTTFGSDGLPTVVDTTWVIPNPTATNAGPANVITGVPNQISGFPAYPPQGAGTAAGVDGVTTCTSFTVLGANGLPTVVDTTWVIPNPTAANGAPANVVTGVPNQISGLPGYPSQVAGTAAGAGGVTTCITYTVLGADGLPTVAESTFVVPASNALPAVTSLGFPSAAPPQVTGLPQSIPPFTPGSGAVTTCITVGVVGPDGVPTPVVQTVVFTPDASGNALPVQTSIGHPSVAPEQVLTGLPQGIPAFTPGSGVFTTGVTVNVVGPDGVATPVVQTIVFTPSIPTLGFPTAPVLTGVPPLPSPNPVLSNGAPNPAGLPTLNGYGNPAVPGLQTILPPSAVVSGLVGPSETVTGTHTSVLTVIAGPGGVSVLPPPYNDPWGNGAPVLGSAQLPENGHGSAPTDPAQWPSSGLYGPLPSAIVPGSPHITTTLQTSTWTNIIPEKTTTYTINFPLTTLATVTIPSPFSPNKRALRRQQSSVTSGSAWSNSSSTSSDIFSENTSLAASLSSALGGETTLSPPLPPVTATEPPQASSTVGRSDIPSMCPTGGKIGNFTLAFDEAKPGPLFNPSGDIWFSEGFVIAPPSSQTSQSYIPSSGGQLVEFVPPSLSPTGPSSGTGDTAEIGVGPNAANPCFRFDFQGASLGCAAEGNEQWCEFEISAYTYNASSTKEASIAWSETKRVPACPNFPHGNCQLTPVQFDGYTNLTSILITLHVGLDLRVWWGDDFKLDWTDNSCASAACRANAAPQSVRRKTVESVARRGVWHWTPFGLERLNDEYIWESVQ